MLVAVAVSVVACSFLGFLWYSPTLFGRVWMQNMHPGKTPEQVGESSTPLVMSVVGHVIAACIINALYSVHFGVTSVSGAVTLGLWLSALVAAMQVSHAAFNRKPLVVFFIDHGYDTACLVLTSIVYTYLG